jgi:hypothetical protein
VRRLGAEDLRGDSETGEALRQPRRHERVNAHALRSVLAIQLTGEIMQLRETAAISVGNEQVDRTERVRKLPLEPLPEISQPSPLTPLRSIASGCSSRNSSRPA